MRKALLLLVLALFAILAPAAVEAAAVPTPPCTLCTLPSGNLCWADYGSACIAPSTGPIAGPSGPYIIGHCTSSQAGQYCPGHPLNPGAGAATDCAMCQLPSGNLCWVDYGSPCTNPPTGPVGDPSGPWVTGHCTPSQADQFCSNHIALTPGGTSTPGGPSPVGPGSPAGPGGPVVEESPGEEDFSGESRLDPP